MKNILLGAAVALTMVACNTEKKETVKTKEVTTEQVAKPIEGKNTPVNLAESTVWYKGSKIVGDAHDGNIPLKNAHFVLNEGKLVGGEFILDMDKMTSNDLEGKAQTDFLAHMKAPDFFDVAKYPTAKFTILSVEHIHPNGEHKLTGNLTIKNTTKGITVPAIVKVDGDNVSIDSEFTFDRTDFGMEFNSESKAADLAKNRIIKDAVEVKVSAKS